MRARFAPMIPWRAKCIACLESSIKTQQIKGLEVMDVAEIAAASL